MVNGLKLPFVLTGILYYVKRTMKFIIIIILPHNCRPSCCTTQYPATKYVPMVYTMFRRHHTPLDPILIYSRTISIN